MDIRVGVRKWNEILNLCGQVFIAATDFDRFQAKKRDHYAILKVEAIYRFDRDFYAGLALSKKDAPSQENLWGITVGWDMVKGLRRTASGNQKSFLDRASECITVPISCTLWVN